MIKLEPLAESDIEWVRQQRNLPAIMKYAARQNAKITPQQQIAWFKSLNKHFSRHFIIVSEDGQRVGAACFDPLDKYTSKAEFGIWIIPDMQRRGLGKEAMLALLDYGFSELRVSTIHGSVLNYPGENRFEFYRKLGFEKYSDDCQHVRVKKEGSSIDAVKFYMTSEMWNKAKMETPAENAPMPTPAVPKPTFKRIRPVAA